MKFFRTIINNFANPMERLNFAADWYWYWQAALICKKKQAAFTVDQ